MIFGKQYSIKMRTKSESIFRTMTYITGIAPMSDLMLMNLLLLIVNILVIGRVALKESKC